jgi:hypothetical protein
MMLKPFANHGRCPRLLWAKPLALKQYPPIYPTESTALKPATTPDPSINLSNMPNHTHPDPTSQNSPSHFGSPNRNAPAFVERNVAGLGRNMLLSSQQPILKAD